MAGSTNPDAQSSGPTPGRTSWRPNKRTVAVLALLVLQTLLLDMQTSGLLVGNGSGLSPLIFYAPVNIGTFILPSLLGALARSWQAAIALAVAPWWATLLLHAGTLLRAESGFGTLGDQQGLPAWMSQSHALMLLLTCTAFALLGWLGWLTGHAVREGI